MNEDRSGMQARVPVATYRLQFNHSFGFDDAAELVGYLHELGISDCYASPVLTARGGSMHGYDVIDHSRFNLEVGTHEQFVAFASQLRSRNMGLVMDVVPNHMCISDSNNLWWQDVLENGPSSTYSRFFDIDWRPPKDDLADKVLLPVLGDQYGRVLENQEIRVTYDDGSFCCWYYESKFPVAPRTYRWILEPALRALINDEGDHEEHVLELESILYALENLPPRNETDRSRVRARGREKEFIKKRLASLVDSSPAVRHVIDESLRQINGTPGVPSSFDRLESLLADQAYRLSFWRVAADEINYRRFFDVNDLAAIRVEEPRVFSAVHGLIFQLMEQGLVTGLRIDHIDGLIEPLKYLETVQHSARAALSRAQDRALLPQQDAADDVDTQRPCYLIVEKILEADEPLRPEWPVHGTTGYDFMNLLNGLFVDSASAAAMEATFRRFTAFDPKFADVRYESKKLILKVSLSSELHVLARKLDRISEQHRYSRDFTFNSLHDALGELITCFPVYRTYVTRGDESVIAVDRLRVDKAVHEALRRNPATSRSIFDFLYDLFLLRDPDGLEASERAERRDFVLSFQQLTGPVMAKGLEDTAFYRYYPLASLNEVGGDPRAFGVPRERFHERNLARLVTWPDDLSATSTHDTKRSEDVRARINVLSEMPGEWERALYRWRELNRPHRGALSLDEDEYLLYQSLIGAWPLGDMNDEQHAQFVERIRRYMEKASKEAKIQTSWVNPNEEYDKGLAEFVEAVLAREGPFVRDFKRFVRPIARAGLFTALSQTLIKIASPGVPDFYQGTEMWDLSLVDPDNRRPVDYAYRRASLAQLKHLAEENRGALADDLMATAEDGRIKLYVTWCGLQLRQAERQLFARGDYVPINVRGAHQERVVSFARVDSRSAVIVAAPRLFLGLGSLEPWPPGHELWEDTALSTDGDRLAGVYVDLLSGQRLELAAQGQLSVAEVFARMPVALLKRIS